MSDDRERAVDAMREINRLAPPGPAPPPDLPDIRTNSEDAAPLSQEKVRTPNRTISGPKPAEPPPLALDEHILSEFVGDLRLAGVAGEQGLAKIVYLAITSRLLPWGKATNRPVSVLVRGSTSTGKSHAMGATLRFFPPEAIVDLGSMSKRFMFYDRQPYSHRVLVVPEAAQVIDDSELLALLRTLLSEGRVVHGTVVGEGKPRAKRIEKTGPTALLMTTTKAYIDEELETRMLSVRSDDTPEQTRRVFGVYAELEEEAAPLSLDRWHDLQRWRAGCGNRVYVPYTRELAELMPVGAPRLRRDFVSMLCLIRAHALLHNATRDRDEDGRTVAELSDYVEVRQLIGALVAEGVEAGVSPAVRETVEAARALLDGGKPDVTPKLLEGQMGVGRTATYDRVRHALKAGYLADESAKDERGMKLVLGSPLPGDADSFLPTEDDIVRLMSGRASGPATPHHDKRNSIRSGSPASPAAPPDKAESEGGREELGLLDELLAGGVPEREARLIAEAAESEERRP